MKDKELINEIIKDTQNCVESLNKLIDTLESLKDLGITQETIQKAVDMRDKYQKIADYNEELLDNSELYL